MCDKESGPAELIISKDNNKHKKGITDPNCGFQLTFIETVLICNNRYM